MITIQKGNHTLQVSKDTYNTMFKRMGYIVVDNKEEVKKEIKKETISKNKNEKKDYENIKESIKEGKDEKENSNNNLEDILGMLSKEDNKKNRQTKNKEEK